MNSIAASLGAKIMTWYLSGQGINANFIQYNALKDGMTALMLEKHESCPICGDNGIEGLGDFLLSDIKAMDKALLDEIGEILVDVKQETYKNHDNAPES